MRRPSTRHDRARSRIALALACGALVLAPALARATTWIARVGEAQPVLDRAAAGDTVRLAAGVHAGPLLIQRALTLRGADGAVVDGNHHGSVIEVGAPGARVEHLEVRASGARVLGADAGIRIVAAPDVRIAGIRMHDVLYGVYAERSDSLEVTSCRLTGRVPPLAEVGDGNGIHLWTCAGAMLRDDHVSGFLDAIYLSFANHVEVQGSTLEDNGRYGLHTMYCESPRLLGNTFTRNSAGIAVMFSLRMRVQDNLVVHNRGPRTYGMLLRDCSDGVFEGNQLVDNTVALFLDGSNRNQFRRNLIQDNGWGLVLFASSADNVWAENDFLHDDYAVALDMRRTRNRFDDGTRGNYWSDAGTYDLNGDGVGDVPYGPVSAFAFVSKQYPDLSVLARSPAVVALGAAERLFPALQPSDAVDRFPLARPGNARVRVADVKGARAGAPGSVALCGGLLALGLAGLAGGRRS